MKQSIKNRLQLICILVLGCIFTGSAAVKLPSIISDHMVLQAGVDAPIWGWATPGEKIEVTISNQTVSTTADQNGNWKVKLKPLSATFDPLKLTIKGTNTIVINDVLIGEVWLGAGQSNMEMELKGSHGKVDNADAEIAAANYPSIRMYLFKENYNIYKLLAPPDQPLKDKEGAWIVCSPQTVTPFSALAYFFGRDLQKEIKRPIGLINSSVGGTPIEAWTSIDVQLSNPVIKPIVEDWKKKTVGYDAEKDSIKYLADKQVWTKDKKIAADAGKPAPKAPAAFKNLIVYKPAGLYNSLIAPLIPYAIKGVLWYQGEKNANGPFTSDYGTQLHTLITDWRTRWDNQFYFIWVQLPRANKEQTLPIEPKGWGTAVRDGMSKTLDLPNTAMAITIDYGPLGHPTNKQDFAKRVLLPVLHDVYQKPLAFWSGPLYKSSSQKGNEITISFTYAEGLKSSNGELKGFAIAGKDKKFVWAKARIEGDKVIVWSDEVSEPASVRYAWAANANTSNLVNGGNLPASPFRTDDWSLR